MREPSGRLEEALFSRPFNTCAGEVCCRLDVALTTGERPGLSSREAVRRLAQNGPNLLVPPGRWRSNRQWAALVADPMVGLLGAAALVDYAIGRHTDAWILVASLVPVLLVDALLHARAELALKAAAARVRPKARVRRDGAVQFVAVDTIVRGDVLGLAEGDVVPADADLVSGGQLSADESSLTGEGGPVLKTAGAAAHEDRRVLAGTAVPGGSGRPSSAEPGRPLNTDESARCSPGPARDGRPSSARSAA